LQRAGLPAALSVCREPSIYPWRANRICNWSAPESQAVVLVKGEPGSRPELFPFIGVTSFSIREGMSDEGRSLCWLAHWRR
jgi:hypothetical protein